MYRLKQAAAETQDWLALHLAGEKDTTKYIANHLINPRARGTFYQYFSKFHEFRPQNTQNGYFEAENRKSIIAQQTQATCFEQAKSQDLVEPDQLLIRHSK